MSAAAVDLTILLTSYNFRPFLRVAVDSLLAQQTDYRFELIVIDDASPDRSAEVLADLDDPRLRVIAHPHNAGFAVRINEGFALAQGEFVARLDGDDVWLPGYVQQLLDALRAHPDATVAFADIRTIDAHGQVGDAGIERPPGPAVRDEFALLLERHYTCAPAMVSRRSAWSALLPWPERYRSGLGDWYFNLRLAELGPFVYVDQVLAHYRVHAGGMHVAFMHDGSGEANTRAILDMFLPRLPAAQAQAIGHAHMLGLAKAYAGQGRDGDARRLYRELIWQAPRLLCARANLPAALGTLLLGTARYTAWKKQLGMLR